jgi:hypothetical protein
VRITQGKQTLMKITSDTPSDQFEIWSQQTNINYEQQSNNILMLVNPKDKIKHLNK